MLAIAGHVQQLHVEAAPYQARTCHCTVLHIKASGSARHSLRAGRGEARGACGALTFVQDVLQAGMVERAGASLQTCKNMH